MYIYTLIKEVEISVLEYQLRCDLHCFCNRFCSIRKVSGQQNACNSIENLVNWIVFYRHSLSINKGNKLIINQEMNCFGYAIVIGEYKFLIKSK